MQFYFRGKPVIPPFMVWKMFFFHSIGIVPVEALKLFRFLYNLFYSFLLVNFLIIKCISLDQRIYLPFVGTEVFKKWEKSDFVQIRLSNHHFWLGVVRIINYLTQIK